ncbi:MAG: hypothetical protein EBT65_02665 [Actinobacteria bacterium]|nr:hypothetical protein [Actinomycetota bacterium]
MSSLIKRARGLVSVLAAAVLIVIPIHTSAASASPGADTSLSVFTVNGNNVSDGDTVTLPAETSSVDAVAFPTDNEATVQITGSTNLVPGYNLLYADVTSADSYSTQRYTVVLSVEFSDDTSLSHFSINGVATIDGAVVSLPAKTTSVVASVETNDVNATFVISGDTDLIVGENILTVTVTAADGTIRSYEVTLDVAFNSDSSATSIQVDGNEVEDGDYLDLDPYTTEVDVLVETTDPEASYEVSGDTDLVAGENTLVITVTAADGVSTTDSYITLNVALSSDASVQVILVNGSDVVDGDYVDLDPYTTEVDVWVETTDADASYEITGATDLVSGENTLTVTVTAADGETTQDYFITLDVALSDDTSLATFQVNGSDVVDGDVVDLDPYTAEVDVVVETVMWLILSMGPLMLR